MPPPVPPPFQPQTSLAATSCDADAVCEANVVLAKNSGSFPGSAYGSAGAQLVAERTSPTSGWAGVQLAGGNKNWFMYIPTNSESLAFGDGVEAPVELSRAGTFPLGDYVLALGGINPTKGAQLKINSPQTISGLLVQGNPLGGSAAQIYVGDGAGLQIFKNSGGGSMPLEVINHGRSPSFVATYLQPGGGQILKQFGIGPDGIGVGTLNPTAELDVRGTAKAKIVETGVMYADAFKLGSSTNCNPAMVYQSAQFSGPQPCGIIEVNSKAAFRDDVEFVTAYADNFKARNHVSADIMTVRSAQAPLNQTGTLNQTGIDTAYACFDKYGNLFRSDTPCR